MGWTEVRNGIHGALVTASGLAADRVIWAPFNAGAPTQPFVALSLRTLAGPGLDWVDTETDLGRPAGQEVSLTVAGFREVMLGIQCFTDPVADSSDALALADTIRSRLVLPGARDALEAVGVVPFDPGPVAYVPDLPAIVFRGRASLDVRCSMPAQAVVEYVGYIASVELTETTSGGGALTPAVRTYTVP